MNKASGGNGIPVELFQILKYDAVKVLHSMCQQICGHRTGKGQFSFQSQRRAMPKNVHTTTQQTHFAGQQGHAQISPSETSTVHKLRTFRFRKGRGTRNQIANIHWMTEKAREFQKNIHFRFIDYTKAFDCVDKLVKILKRQEYQITIFTF